MSRDEFLFLCAEGTGEQVINAIKSGADPNEKFIPASGLVKRALDIAVSMDNADTTAALIASGADPNFQDINGRTALMYAVLVSPGIVRVLLDNGANPNIRDNKGRTALGMAVAGHDTSMEKFMYIMIRSGGFGAKGWEDWLFLALIASGCAREEQLDTISILLDNGADPNIRDKDGMNALAYAFSANDDEIFAMLAGIN